MTKGSQTDATASTLSAPIRYLKGVGPQTAEKLARLGIQQVWDLFFHLPLRYQDRTRIVPIGALVAGEEALVQGEVQASDVRFGRRRMLLARISDGTGSLTLRFFHFSARQQAALKPGIWLRCYGEVRHGQVTLELAHPEYHEIEPNEPLPADARLTPIYPTTEGVRQASMRALTDQALSRLLASTASTTRGEEHLQELLPDEVLTQLGMPPLAQAIHYVHRPPVEASQRDLAEGSHPAQQRLAFEELLAQQLSMQQLRQKNRAQRAPSLAVKGVLRQQLLAQLPFQLTGAQQRVIDEVIHDMQQASPMQRLVQGDVGCGKTVVAALAVLQAVEAGYQAVVMAPTELLAEQHRQNFAQWLLPLSIEMAWLSGRSKGKVRSAALAQIRSGEAQLVVGTHALFQEEVVFDRLGFVVVDEQHRFGVHQRLALREKGRQQHCFPHQLIMTATPIPRTLAMTAYADLDLSVIDELPPGRKAVETVVLQDGRRDEVVQRVHQACRSGCQAYWVCTLIEESERLQCQAAEESVAQLAEALPDLRVALVHGRLKAQEKAAVMAAFKAGEIDLLVATTVIEVGVDVPSASLMVIENAERLGLAQLHQLRGRVGRGSEKSHCVLLYHAPLSAQGKARLAAMRETNDGFEIARRDLALRGPGEILGTRQTGELQFRIADIARDQAMLPDVNRTARLLMQRYPQRVAPIIRRWLGDAARYGEV